MGADISGSMQHQAHDLTHGSPRYGGEPRGFARAFIVLLLLVGLWMMHGMSGATDAGCHGAAMPLPMTASAAMPNVAAAPALTSGASSAAPLRAATSSSIGTGSAGQMRHGDLCVSGQPPTPGQDLLALLALLALAAYGMSGLDLGLSVTRAPHRTQRQAPPGLFGIRLLTAVCVSRT